jgi:hypothetical protein
MKTLSLVGGEAGDSVIRTYSFDSVMPPASDNKCLYDVAAKSIIDKVRKFGVDGTVFFYGQTGAGKTHSCFGDILSKNSVQAEACDATNGVVTMGLRDLYNAASDTVIVDGEPVDVTTNLPIVSRCVQFYEIFQERVYDLLDFSTPSAANGQQQRKSLPVRTHPTKGSYIEGITSLPCETLKQALTAVKKGFKARATSATGMNDQSSRSHAVLRLATTHSDKTVSHLTFVDLAGSERQIATGATGDRLKEAGCINQSLSVLGGVIYALGMNCNTPDSGDLKHVPYRDSKLTLLLRSSLGTRNCVTSMVMNVSPCGTMFAETLSTLKFAQRVKLIKVPEGVEAKYGAKDNSTEEGLRKEIGMLRMEVERLKEGGGETALSATASSASAAVVDDGTKDTIISANLSKIAALETAIADLTQTLTTSKLESEFVYKLKQSRIEQLQRMGGRDAGTADDDLTVLCEEIDMLRAQLKKPSDDAVKFKLLYNVEKSAPAAKEEVGQLTKLVEVLTEEKKMIMDKMATVKQNSDSALATARTSTTATSNSLQRKLKDMKDRAEDAEEDLGKAREELFGKEEICAELKVAVNKGELQVAKLGHELEQARLDSKHSTGEVAKLREQLEGAQKKIRSNEVAMTKLESEYEEKMDELQNQLFMDLETKAESKAATEEELVAKIAVLAKENSFLEGKVKSFEGKLEVFEKERETRGEEMEAFEKEREAWVKRGEEQALLNKQRMDALELELQRACERAEKWERVSEENERRASLATEELRKSKKKCDDAAFERENLQEDMDTMTEQVKYFQMQNEDLEIENKRLNTMLNIDGGGEGGGELGEFDANQEDSELMEAGDYLTQPMGGDPTEFDLGATGGGSDEGEEDGDLVGEVEADEREVAFGEEILERERQEMVLLSAKNETSRVEISMNESAFFPNESRVYDLDEDLVEDEDENDGEENWFTPAKARGEEGISFSSPATPLMNRDPNVL